ncbi:hypothetical protein [Burkholderia ubonensis]|uniref:hypothetical protein n=1 Tax=Burkholderia ubonensis TaxID=101571 RepID=UPI0009B30B69|nr:hypothetical protein [Burkholderia ubonensis]
MDKKFQVGQKVKCIDNGNTTTGPAAGLVVGHVYTVVNVRAGGDVYLKEVKHPVTGWWLASRFEVAEVHPFTAGDLVTPNDRERDKAFTQGKPYKVRRYTPREFGHCAVIHFESDDGGNTGRFRPADFYVPYVARPQPEPTTEFRIRKHGTALREVRGTPFATQQEAEQAVSRYTPGSVYEIVEVKVVRTVKVEQEVRVIDYKEAA